jgi:hypothetical protein
LKRQGLIIGLARRSLAMTCFAMKSYSDQNTDTGTAGGFLTVIKLKKKAARIRLTVS